MQDYRTVWDSSIGAYYVAQRSVVPTQSIPIAVSASTESSLPTNSQQHTTEEGQAIFRPAKFNWADSMEDENEPLSVRPIRTYVTPAMVTTANSSETASVHGTDSQPSTPITLFSRDSSPALPSFKVAETQGSRLVLSLDLAANNDKADKPRESLEFNWLDLIQYDNEYRLFGGKIENPGTEELLKAYKRFFSVSVEKLHVSGLLFALDLAQQEEPQDPNEPKEAAPRRTSHISEYLDLHEHPVQNAARLAENTATKIAALQTEVDGQEVIQVEEVQTGEDKPQLAHESSVFERIDLDAIFGGPADDLCEGYEVEHRAARANIDLAAHQGTINAHDTSEEDGLYSKLKTVSLKGSGKLNTQRKPGPVSPDLLPKSPSETSPLGWGDILAVTQRAKQDGVYKHEPLKATDRSKDWFWEPSNDDNRHHYDHRILSTALESTINQAKKVVGPAVEEVQPHHLNYLQQPVFHKTDTPPEVSLWVVCSGQAKFRDPFSRQGVVSAQAGKLIDPFCYSGPLELLQFKGTRLRDEVTGYVEKEYHPTGTWILDRYSSDETVPHAVEGNAYTDIFNSPYWFYSPQPVYRMFYAKEARRLTDGNISLDLERADLEDPIVNDDGRMHGVNKPKRDGNWVLPPPSRLSIVEACMQETSDLEPLSPKPRQTQSSQFSGNQSVADHLNSILPEQSEEAVAAEDADFYNSAAVTVPSEPAEAEEGGKTVEESDGSEASTAAATAQGPQLAEAEEGENGSSEESEVSAGSRALRDMLESPDFLLTMRYVDAIADCKEDEAAAILALRNELRARAPIPNNTYQVSDDGEQVDYSHTWVRRNVRLVSNEAYLSQWSENAAVDEHGDGDFLEEEAPAQGDVDCGISSPADLNEASTKRSFSIDDDATPEDLELEKMDDESPKVISKLRDLGELPPPSPEGQRQFKMDMNVGGAFDAEQEQSQGSSVMVSSSNKEFFAKVLEEIRKISKSFAPDGVDVNPAVSEDITALERRMNLPDEFFTSRGYDRPMTIEEEDELLDRGHIAAMTLQEQADAEADTLLNAYLGHLKRYHRQSLEVSSDKVSTLEVVVPEDMENTSVLDEDSQEACERDPEDDATTHDSSDTEEYEVEVVSVGSEELDALLLKVNSLLAIRQKSDIAVQDSPTASDKALSVVDHEEERLDQGIVEEDQLVEEREQLAEAAEKLAGREKVVAEREEKLAEEEKKLAQREKDLVEEKELLAVEKARIESEKQLADQGAQDENTEQEVVGHAFDTILYPSNIPPATPTFNEHFFGSFAIAVGGRASRLAMGLSGVLLSSATVLHRR